MNAHSVAEKWMYFMIFFLYFMFLCCQSRQILCSRAKSDSDKKKKKTSQASLFLTPAAAGFSVMAMDTSPVLEPFCTDPNGEPKNTDEGSVLTSRNLTSEPTT